MSKIFIFLIFASAVFYFSADTRAMEAIDLNDPSVSVDIPLASNEVKLTRGTYTYTLSKKSGLENKKYVVYLTDIVSFTSEHKPSPDDAYARSLVLVPADDASAVRGMRNFKEGTFKIETKEDMAKSQLLINDVNRLNQVKFTVGILAADNSVAGISKRIKKDDTISVYGIHFRHSEVINNSRKEPLSHCLAHQDVFYLTGLEIE